MTGERQRHQVGGPPAQLHLVRGGDAGRALVQDGAVALAEQLGQGLLGSGSGKCLRPVGGLGPLDELQVLGER
ncbi:MAG: hypothetical protein AB2L07_22290 [Thermoanaerobaculaceae bacterium]